MATVYTLGSMEIAIKENLKIASNMAKEFSISQMEIHTKVTTNKVNLQVMGSIIGSLVVFSKVSLKMAWDVGKVSGRKEQAEATNMKVAGKLIKNKDMEFLRGLMAVSTGVISATISKKVKDKFRISMEHLWKVFGITINQLKISRTILISFSTRKIANC